MSQNDKPVTAVAVSEKRSYLLSFTRKSGDIENQVSRVYKRKTALEVLRSIAEEIEYPDPDESGCDPETDSLRLEGEFFDAILRGGDWVYSDLSVELLRDGMEFFLVSGIDMVFENGKFRGTPIPVHVY